MRFARARCKDKYIRAFCFVLSCVLSDMGIKRIQKEKRNKERERIARALLNLCERIANA